ncbi:MAG TPA: helix-turn-helix transcriptional regulator [Fimbriimonas sp.]|nr:helix-turn-helix transcriptional regulator [Fimbriimonas sp.]
MAIEVNLAVIMAMRKVKLKDLADRVGISEVNLSQLKNGHVQGIRFGTLSRLCRELECEPGDILKYVPDPPV